MKTKLTELYRADPIKGKIVLKELFWSRSGILNIWGVWCPMLQVSAKKLIKQNEGKEGSFKSNESGDE